MVWILTGDIGNVDTGKVGYPKSSGNTDTAQSRLATQSNNKLRNCTYKAPSKNTRDMPILRFLDS